MSKSKKSKASKGTKTSNTELQAIVEDISFVASEIGVAPHDLLMSEYLANGGEANHWTLRKNGGFNQIKKTFFEKDVEKDLATITELKDIRKQYRGIEKQIGNSELFLQRIANAVSKIPVVKAGKYKPLPKKKRKKSEPRTVNLVLSDLHFGSDLDKEEVGVQWGTKEEARSFAKVVRNVCSYKMQYRSQTKLAVFLLGDIIENELHGRTSADLLHIQTCRAIHLLTQAVARFSESFPEVEIYFAVGNHGRDTALHKNRATHHKFNALETTIYYAVKTASRGLKNVKFFQPKTPYIMMESQGHKVYATHGDTHLNPGNPGRQINTSSLEGQINRINSSLKDHEEFKVFVCGHVHMPTILQLANGAHLIVNGALVPPNAFAQSLNIMESRQTQVMWESTPERAVGDTRIIDVTNDPDTPDLDAIIQPFPGLDV